MVLAANIWVISFFFSGFTFSLVFLLLFILH